MGPPSDLIIQLQSLISHTRSCHLTSISLLPNLKPESAISLAAVLLDYPVAYVPARPDSSLLSNVPLDIYECVLNFNGTTSKHLRTHTLLKFSCPSILAIEHPNVTGSRRIISCLTHKFHGRIEKSIPSAYLLILSSSQTLDRVAL